MLLRLLQYIWLGKCFIRTYKYHYIKLNPMTLFATRLILLTLPLQRQHSNRDRDMNTLRSVLELCKGQVILELS